MISKDLSSTLGFAVREAKKDVMNTYVWNMSFMRSCMTPAVLRSSKGAEAISAR